MKNILRNSNFGFTKWCVALIAAGWMGASVAMAQTTLAGWDFNGYTGGGSSPQVAGSTDANVAVGGLTRGSAFSTSGTPAGNAWGTTASVISLTSAAAAVTANSFVTFTIKPNTGYTLSLSGISAYNIRRSASGSTTGQWQYSINGSTFTDIGTAITWGTTTTSSGNAQTAITLSGISALQNLRDTTTVTFRCALWGASGASGTWYLNNFQTGNDFVVTGTVSAAATAPTVSSSAATSISATGATLNGNVTSNGGATVTERGFVYNTSSPVTINDNKTIVSGTTGAFSNNVSSLTTGATYYFRAYASNSVGVTLSSEQNFTTGAIAGPTLIPATLATVDTAFEVTFPDDATWRGVISGFKVDGVELTGGFVVSSGKITFTPSSSVPTAALQSPGTKSITVSATGYNDATVSQVLGAGQASKLVITTQPAAPAVNPGTFATQPVVALQDRYGNNTASTAEVTAAVGAGTWTLGGTATVAAANGTAMFAGLTASSASAVTGATISFSSGSLEAVSSAAFNLAAANELQLAAVGTAVTQNFDSLARTDSSLMPLGWFFVETGTAANTTYAAGTGSSATGNIYSFGADGLTERALGGLQSGSLVPVFGAKIRNTTGSTLTDLSISYVGERWRLGATGREDRLDFEYSTDATSLSDGTWNAVSTLNFTAPSSSGATGPLNGNDVANRVTVTGTVQNLSLANGAALWIRWVDFNASGTDDGLGIDDFSVTGIVNAVAAPQFALAGGEYLSNQVVKIANFAALTTAGAIVYYTVDGSTPTASSTPYNDTSGVALTAGNGSITVQAVAIKGADVSSVASANYHLPKDVANLAALRASAAGSTIYRVTGEVTFTGGTTFRNTKFFQDVGAGIQIDDVGGILTTPYLAGDNVRNIVGKIALFNGQLQMVPLQDFGPAVSSGNVITPLSRTLATLTDADQARLVTISGVEYQGADGTLVFTTATATINTAVRDSSTGATYSGWVRNIFSDSDVTGKVIPTGAVTVTGIVQKTLINSVQSLTVGPRNSAEAGAPPALEIRWSINLAISEDGANFYPEAQYLTLSRVGNSTGDLQVLISCNPESRLALQDVGVLPQTIIIPAGEISTQVKLMPVNDSNYTGDTLVAITATAASHTGATASASILEDEAPKTTPTISVAPTASPITVGQALSVATLTGGSASVAGTFDWTIPTTVPAVGTTSHRVTFTPTDTVNYNTFTTTVSVTVNPAGTTYNGWLNGADASDAAFLDYVFGALTPGTLDPTLKPSVAIVPPTGGAGGDTATLVLTYYVRQNTVGLTVTPKTSADVAAAPSVWTTVIDDVAVGSPTTRSDGVTVQMRKASVPMIGDRKFLKLEVLQE